MMLANVALKTMRDRWRSTAIAAMALTALLFFSMAIYRDFDLTMYTSFPEVFRSLVNIPEDADVAGLSYSATYASYGSMALAGLALAMGAASIAAEERRGTIGLLLSNPKSRTSVLASKTAAMILLTGLAALFLWGAGLVAPVLLDVDIAGMHVGALVFHMFVLSMFFGFLATAIGAWTGSFGTATGVTAGIMFASFIAAGLFPVIEGLESAAKVSPWYYFSGGDPVNNGVIWGHMGVLLAGIVLFSVVAVVGVNRRDLRSKTVAVTLMDRLRGNPLTQTLADRVAGSARVSHIWAKTTSEHQGLLFVSATVMFLVMGVALGPLYALIDDTFAGMAADFPDVLLALFGGGDMSTPEGLYQVESLGTMAPIAVMVVTMAIGAGALAGEEERRTMGLLLANPISRSKVVLEKAAAMVLYGVLVGVSIFAGVAAGSLLGRLGMDMGNIAATSLLVTLLGIAFGALALALSAATGQVRVAVFGTVGVALVLFVLNAFLPLTDTLGGYAKWSPFYYYLSSDPLINGMHWGHGAVLSGLAVGLVALSVVLFDRRDLRTAG